MMKRTKIVRIMALLLVFACLLGSVAVFAASGSTTVYITNTGSKYHTGSCSYLHSSKIATSLSSAVSRGYTPCSRCDPPSLTYARWVERGGNWYYLDADDNESVGWDSIGGTWYYFEPDGKMVTGLRTIDGATYYFESGGAMVTGWQDLDGTWYYFESGGAAVTGWSSIGGTWYYFEPDGKMVTGLRTIDGAIYYFESGGAMVTGWQDLDGTWYYFESGGAAVTGWSSIGGTRYYFDSDGKMATGWETIDGETYYFADGGAMVTGEQEIGSEQYLFDENGVLQQEPEDERVLPEESYFQVHFIDVGQADAALVLCDEQAMLIDGGNSEDSDRIYSYLESHDISHLDYIVATHGHEDHVGGLSGALNYATVGTAYCSVLEYDSEAFEDFVTYLEQQEVEITVPSAGDSFSLGSATVEVLGPVTETEDANNMSIVLRIVYGETSFLFTGDAEREEEQDILDAGYTLESTVLKVGHHGSENSTTYPFLREIMPEYAVISVGENNSYGHPTEEALSRLQDAEVEVYRTDLQGTILCESDGETVAFTVEKTEEASISESAEVTGKKLSSIFSGILKG